MRIKYTLMQKNYPVMSLIFEERTGMIVGVDEIIDKARIPLDSFTYTKEGEIAGVSIEKLNQWWTKRGLPERRDGIKNVLSFFQITEINQLQFLNNGLSLSDTYWIIKPSNNVKWEDVNFFTNDYSNDVGNLIFGLNKKSLENFDTYSPDLSTNGWLKKAWLPKKNKRYLVKAGSEPEFQEPINELLASKLLEALNFVPFVKYTIGQVNGYTCSVCKNFLNDSIEYVPAYLIYRTKPRDKETSIYDHLIERCHAYGVEGIETFIDKLLQVDYVLQNADRHLGNFGFIRDVDTLKILGPAPLFDNGTSLWNKTATDKLLTALNLSKPFARLHSDQIKFVNNFYITPEFLEDIPDIFEEIMNLKTKMSRERIKGIRNNLYENIEDYKKILDKVPPEHIIGLDKPRKELLNQKEIEKKPKLNNSLDTMLLNAEMAVKAAKMLKQNAKIVDSGLKPVRKRDINDRDFTSR